MRQVNGKQSRDREKYSAEIDKSVSVVKYSTRTKWIKHVSPAAEICTQISCFVFFLRPCVRVLVAQIHTHSHNMESVLQQKLAAIAEVQVNAYRLF